MKKILSFSILALVLIPSLALAASFRSDSNIPQSEVIIGNVYLAGGSPVVAGTIQGDLYSAGGNIVVTGSVEEDAVIVGGSITVTGSVGGDLRAFGGSVMVDGRVDGEILVSGGKVVIGPNAIVRKDLVAGGGNVTVDPKAQIFGSSKIMTDKDREDGRDEKPYGYFLRAGFWVTQVFATIAIFIVVAAFMGFYPNVVGRFILEATRKGSFWKLLGIGFLVLVLTPIAAFLLLLTGVGALLGVILLLAYVSLLLFSCALASVIFGGILKMVFARKKKKSEFSWGWLILGVVALHLLTLIPYVGGLVMLVMLIYSLGTVGVLKWKVAKAIK